MPDAPGPRSGVDAGSASGADSAPVAVVGGGLAGLAAAYRLHRAGVDVHLFEASHRVGGVVASHRQDGFLAESGPHSLGRPAPRIRALLSEAGLDPSVVTPDPRRAHRFIFRHGDLHPLPTSIPDLLTTRLLGKRSLLRILGEPFRWGRSSSPDGDESVADLLRRRGLGEELVQTFLDPFVAGVYAGDPERLSVRHAFPLLHGLVEEHGSLVRGLALRGLRGWTARRRPKGTAESPPPAILSFREGMEEIPQALARPLAGRIRTGTSIQGIRAAPDAPGWELLGEGGHPLGTFPGVVLALPAHALAHLSLPGEPASEAAGLREIRHPPVTLVTLGFPQAQGQPPLDGFGMLVPRVEGRRILGALFPSTLFPGRAPPGHLTVAVFIGGTRQPELALQDPHALEGLARDELSQLLGIRQEPVFRHHRIWRNAIPQFEVGYERFQETARRLETLSPRGDAGRKLARRCLGGGRPGIGTGRRRPPPTRDGGRSRGA
jgi:protoporphyrinogen/coproporphyrinogen III oxidase